MLEPNAETTPEVQARERGAETTPDETTPDETTPEALHPPSIESPTASAQPAADLLEQPMTRAKLYALAESGRFSKESIRALGEVCERDAPWRAPSARSWHRFVGAHLLAIGVVLLAAGAAFFFAANWSAMGGLVRMGLVATALASSAAVGARLGTERVAGRAALTLSALLVGPLLAVYGQTYQTGADAYDLFLAWGLLLTPYLLLVRWTGLFVFQVLLFELAFGLYADQATGARLFRDAWVHVGLAAMNAAALVAVEIWQWRRASRSGARSVRWPARAFLVATLFFLLPRAMEALGDRGLAFALERAGLELLAIAVTLLVVWLRYRRAPKDLFALAAVGLSLVLLAACGVAHALQDFFRREAWAVFFTGLFVMASMGVVGAWIRHHMRTVRLDEDDDRDAWEDAPVASGDASGKAAAAKGVVDEKAATTDELSVAAALERARARGVELPVEQVAAVLAKPPAPPLAVRALLGLGIWIGAGMVAAILDVIEGLLEADAVRFVAGLGLLGAAAFFSRRERWGDLRLHLTVLSVVMGEILLGSTFPRSDALMLLCFAVMQVGILFVAANMLTRFTSTLLALLAVWLLLNEELHLYDQAVFHNDLLLLAISAGAVIVWTARDRMLASRAASLQAPVGYGLAVGVVGMAVFGLICDVGLSRWVSFTSPAVVAAGLFGLALVLGVAVLRDLRARDARRVARGPLVALALGAGVVAVAGHRHPELLAALLLVGLGHARRERGLYALGVVLLGAALVSLYYELGTTLLSKSLVLALTGAALLGIRKGMLIVFGDPGSPRREQPVEERAGLSFARSVAVPGLVLHHEPGSRSFLARRGGVAVAVTVALSLGVPFGLAAQRERIAREGTTVLLELAPQDPRSILQGDYMTLRYAGLERLSFPGTWHEPVDGAVVVFVDDRGVGRFLRVDDGAAIAENELRLRYRKRRGAVRIGAESFFFEEGQGARYQGARYGELKVSPSGEVVLVGLRDASLSRL